jgi:hypothetical protein
MTIEDFGYYFKLSLNGGVNYLPKGKTYIFRSPSVTGNLIRIAWVSNPEIFYQFNFGNVITPLVANEDELVSWFMANNTEIINSVSATGNSVGWVKVTKTYQDFSDASTENDIEIYSLPAKGIIHKVLVKHSTPFNASDNPVTGEILDTESYTPVVAEVVGTGPGTTFPIALVNYPTVPTTIVITDGVEIFTDDGLGVLTGDLGGSGTITYDTGIGSVTFNSAVGAVNVTCDYSYGQKTFTPNSAFSPVNPFSVVITDTVETFTDDGLGTLAGDLGGFGLVDYLTGGFEITFNTIPADAQDILIDYSYSTVSAYTLSVGLSGDLERYIPDTDVYISAGDDVFALSTFDAEMFNFATSTSVRANAKSTGANLDEMLKGVVVFNMLISNVN